MGWEREREREKERERESFLPVSLIADEEYDYWGAERIKNNGKEENNIKADVESPKISKLFNDIIVVHDSGICFFRSD